ncbi:MAG: hypothetical protein WCG25_08070 [bacterium]
MIHRDSKTFLASFISILSIKISTLCLTICSSSLSRLLSTVLPSSFTQIIWNNIAMNI